MIAEILKKPFVMIVMHQLHLLAWPFYCVVRVLGLLSFMSWISEKNMRTHANYP
jgi:hypothetical protein